MKSRIGVVSVSNCRAFSKRLSPAAILKFLKYAKRRFCDKIKVKALLSWAELQAEYEKHKMKVERQNFGEI